MPRPVSVTLIKAKAPSARVESVTVPPSGEYLTALLTRLLSTWTSRSRSPATIGSRGARTALNSTTPAADQPALLLASVGHILDHDEHLLRAAGDIGNRGRRELQPQPPAAAGGGANLDASLVCDPGQQRSQSRPARGLVVRAQQVGPCLGSHRIQVVLEHVEQGPVPFQELAFAGHPRDADRRMLIDRSMVGFAAPQRLLGFGAL